MSQGNPVLQVRVTGEMWDEIAREIDLHNKRSKNGQWDMSAWLRAAVQDKIDHSKRGRGGKRKKLYRCTHCSIRFPLQNIAFTSKPFWGKIEYECTNCARVGVSN